MTHKEWMELFPQAQISKTIPFAFDGKIVPLENGEFLLIDNTQLTKREQMLLQALGTQQSLQIRTRSSWQRYVEDGGKFPDTYDKIQFIHICLIQKNKDFHETEWLSVMQELFGSVIAAFQCFKKHYTFILNANTHPFAHDELTHMQATIEEDFSISMRFFIGNPWSTQLEIPQLYQAEKSLFVGYLHESNKQVILEFAPTILWGMLHKKIDISPIPSTLTQLMDTDDAALLVEALWEERGTLTKAAQKLYVHRNTLQYRIDRFFERTGLRLKNFDDLTLCHLLLNMMDY